MNQFKHFEIETATESNLRCSTCPVSISPRPAHEYWNDGGMEQSKRFFRLEQDQQQMIGCTRTTTNQELGLLAGLDFAKGRLDPARHGIC